MSTIDWANNIPGICNLKAAAATKPFALTPR
jgi:hypothetical protein